MCAQEFVVNGEHWTCCGSTSFGAKFCSKVKAGDKAQTAEFYHPEPTAVECKFNEALIQDTGAFTVQNDGKKVKFPAGPICIVSDLEAGAPGGPTMISLTFRMRGNSAWGVGALKQSNCTAQELGANMHESHFQKAALASKEMSGSHLTKKEMHEKIVCVVLDSVACQVTFLIQGMTEAPIEKPMNPSDFPARIGIMGFNGAIANLVTIPQKPVAVPAAGKVAAPMPVAPAGPVDEYNYDLGYLTSRPLACAHRETYVPVKLLNFRQEVSVFFKTTGKDFRASFKYASQTNVV
jgi:hypothetical protein